MELVFDKEGCSVAKGPVIYKKEGNCLMPILYLRKPKNASQEDFNVALDFLINKAIK
jgi:hypothetical protein